MWSAECGDCGDEGKSEMTKLKDVSMGTRDSKLELLWYGKSVQVHKD